MINKILYKIKEVIEAFNAAGKDVDFKLDDYHSVNGEYNTITIGLNLSVGDYGSVRIELDLDEDGENNLNEKLAEEYHTINE